MISVDIDLIQDGISIANINKELNEMFDLRNMARLFYPKIKIKLNAIKYTEFDEYEERRYYRVMYQLLGHQDRIEQKFDSIDSLELFLEETGPIVIIDISCCI